MPGLVLAQQEAFEEVLNEGVRRLTAMGFQPKAKLGLGDPGEEIAAVAREISADLVVVGHRQQGTLTRWWRGSVGMRLINNLGCSLLVGRLDVGDDQLMPSQSPAVS